LEAGFLALPLRPRAIVVLGVERGPFAQQELCSLDLAPVRRQVERRLASGSWAKAPLPGDDGESSGQLSSTDATDKGTMNVLDPTSSNLFKAKKHLQTH